MSKETENPLSRRLNKILEARFENDPETLEALNDLSTFYKENSPQSRRNLRSQIEKRSLAINENFLSEFRQLKNALDDVYNDVAAMSASVQEMTTRLQNAKAQTKSLIDQTTGYQQERAKLDVQLKVATALIDHFQLSPVELASLHGASRDSPITEELFSALDRVQKIHSDCRVLIQSGHQTLALDIMEQMTLHQEAALERLYRWAQQHCRNVNSAEITPLVTKAMARLQDRPVLFKYVIEEYCTAHRANLVSDFIDALTKATALNPHPIDLNAHDPQRYVGEMLAWLNQTIPIEKNSLYMLVELCNKTDITAQLDQALGNISEGVCHPMKVRIEKVLMMNVSAVTLYAVANTIRYYNNSICQFVKEGMLQVVLSELQEQSEKAFLKALEEQVIKALVRVESPPRDLSPAPVINRLLSLLREVLSTAAMNDNKEKDMQKIVVCVLDPILRAVNEQAARLPPTDMAVYLLNCLYAMQTCLSLYEFMDDRLERLQAQAEAQVDTLTSEQAGSLVANLNLGPIYTILQDQGKGPLSSIPGMEPSNLRNFLARLDSLTVMPDMVLLPQIGLLESSKHRASVQKRSFSVLIGIYKQLYEGVRDPANQYQNPDAILSKSPEELERLLLS